MEKKDLVAMFMESPFYFDILLGHRLVIVQQHAPRFLDKTMLNQSIDSKKFTDSIVVDERDRETHPVTRLDKTRGGDGSNIAYKFPLRTESIN